jgi:NADP-dependent 3-hydroxy acid dehydrogenase YdfG
MTAESVFFISGAASGIGAATVDLVTSKGHRVAVCDINLPAAVELCDRIGPAAKPIELDVRKPDSWQRALDEAWSTFGGVDVLVNNAGLIHTGWVIDQSVDECRHMVEVNLLGVINGAQAITPRFISQGHGHIVTVGSLAAFVPLPGQTVYAATKHAVRAFHHGFAIEQQESPIDFTLVCPGPVDTPMLRKQLSDDAAALTFSDPAIAPQTVARAILDAAERKPREILIPAATGAALRVLGTYPGIVARMVRRAQARGRAVMEKKRRGA